MYVCVCVCVCVCIDCVCLCVADVDALPLPPCLPLSPSFPLSLAEVNTLDISGSGEFFVSGGGDKLVKLFHYDEGQCQAVGIGHSGTVTKVVVSPDQRNVVSVGDEGAILIWNIPERFVHTNA
jgi:WD40 repeat protein